MKDRSKPRQKLNILFTCAGRRVAVIQAFRQALEQLGVEGNIIGTDSSHLSAGLNVCDDRYIVPYVDDPGYIPTLYSICQKHNVGLLLPLTDLDLLTLAQNRAFFTKINVLVLVSSPKVIQICQDKWHTSHFFQAYNIPTVKILSPDNLGFNNITYPLFMKPANGSGSVNSFKVNNPEELSFFLNYIPNPLVQEYARGQEHTIDILTDLTGQVINAVPRRRLEVRAGEINKGVTVKDLHLIEATIELVQKLGAIGAITVQCFVDSSYIQFIEINPRMGGGLPLAIAAGANYPTQIIQMALGQVVEPCIGDFIDNFYMLRYENAIYLSSEQVYDEPKSHIV